MKLKLSPRAHSTRGFSLTEVAIVLGVVGIVLGGIWAYAASMNEKVKQERFSQLLIHIVDNIRGNFAGTTYFDTTNAVGMMGKLTDRGIFPADMVVRRSSVSYVISPFGEFPNPNPDPAGATYKSLYVCGWKANGSDACVFSGGTSNVPLFAIEVLLPKAACITAALRNSNEGSFPGLVAIFINTLKPDLPLTLSDANTKCSESVNRVDFVFKLVP